MPGLPTGHPHPRHIGPAATPSNRA
jgi:hypothetical protein